MITNEELDELERLESAATTGYWKASDRGIGYEVCQASVPINSQFRETFLREDAQLIAALRNQATSLISAAKENARLREALEEVASGAVKINRQDSRITNYSLNLVRKALNPEKP